MTFPEVSAINGIVFQSTLPARGATGGNGRRERGSAISIHAPRTGSDRTPRSRWPPPCNFNPRSPHGERPSIRRGTRLPPIFQSTLPARGATQIKAWWLSLASHFNPRSPHGERRPGSPDKVGRDLISIHAPRTGSDGHDCRAAVPRRISIHAPRTGSDPGENPLQLRAGISIHAPRTGSDNLAKEYYAFYDISIHAPRTGSDFIGYHLQDTMYYFNPRSPHGERLLLWHWIY